MIHLHAIHFIDRAIPWASSTGAVVATNANPGPLPSWAEGGLVGIVILCMGYAIRHLFDKLEQARGEKIKGLEDEVEALKAKIVKMENKKP